MAHAHRRHRGTELPWLFAGRRVKPLGVAAILWCVGATVGPWSTGPGAAFDYDSALGWVESVASVATLLLLLVAWLIHWQRGVEIALLLTCAVFAGRAMLALLSVGVVHPATWIAAGCAAGAGGAYLLERGERRWPAIADRRHGMGGRE
jgi:hypothetical protein